ncbi:Cullin-domain-containing protein, partial [Basidiobolus meristosporus CBS 931.73]
YSAPPKVSDEYILTQWGRLKRAINEIQQNQPLSEKLEELYQVCQNLCHQKKAAFLYEKLEVECRNHVVLEKEKLERDAFFDEPFLITLNDCWTRYCSQMHLIRSIFLYLDRTFALHTSGMMTSWDMGLSIFNKFLMTSTEIRKKALSGILNAIEKERFLSTWINSMPQVLKSLLRMYSDLGIYLNGFERPFLEATTLIYRGAASERIANMEIQDYLLYVEERLLKEKERCLLYLDEKTRRPLIELVEHELVKKHAKALLEKGFESLVNTNARADLSRLYILLERVGELELLRAFFGFYTKRVGLQIVTNQNKDCTMVQDLLNFKEKLDLILDTSFQKNEGFSNTLKDSFESFLNIRQHKPAEMIAKYIDSKLRSTSKISESEVDAFLDQSLVLFRFVQGKDVFEAFYKRDLAKRLLLNKSVSLNVEKSFISKLKAECGPGFTSKLEGMFKDMNISRELMDAFHQSKKYKDTCKDTELHVSVLTQGFWPAYRPSDARLPPQMMEYQDLFKDFYHKRYRGRHLIWQSSLGYCVLKGYFPKGNKELVVSLYQAIILFLFNDAQTHPLRLSYLDIFKATNIEKPELDRALASLTHGKTQILLKYPNNPQINSTDLFAVNEEFTAPLLRIKTNAVQLEESVEDNAITTEKVFQDRQYQVDAAIVRIMKFRKTLGHTELINELLEQLKFPMKATDLKKRIESLIDRDYLERDKSDGNMYNYLA